MRISVLMDDPGYCERAKRSSVYLNGRFVHDVYTADDKLGEVVVVKRDANGDIETDGNSVAMETLKGRVRIEFWDERPPE